MLFSPKSARIKGSKAHKYTTKPLLKDTKMATNDNINVDEIVEEIINLNYGNDVEEDEDGVDPLKSAYLSRDLDADAVRNLMHSAAEAVLSKLTH